MFDIKNEKIKSQLIEEATEILASNSKNGITMPSNILYPHQWFWDSCFIAIGLRHIDIERAKSELVNLVKGQWKNGMIPNIVFANNNGGKKLSNIWRSQVSPFSPDNVFTSGITQPPMLAEAVYKVGEMLDKNERKLWYGMMLNHIVDFHEWLYSDRDPHSEGLVLLLHPYESGMDNSPPWMDELHKSFTPKWIKYTEKLHLDIMYNFFRLDTKFVNKFERMNNVDAMSLYSLQINMRNKQYNTEKILGHNSFAIEDLAYNSILIRANDYLEKISNYINKEIPKNLKKNIKKTRIAIESLWDEENAEYFSRRFETHKLIKISSIASLLPLYSGAITQERAKHLVTTLESHDKFSVPYIIPTVPVHSEWFSPNNYWQGPTWINMNWLIIEGLKNYGFNDHANILTRKTLELVESGGFAEYFNPIDGRPLGIDNFSWTAALTIDLLSVN